MNRAGYILSLCAILVGTAVSAQTYEKVLQRNLWNSSSNVTGVRQDSLSRSYAELSGGYEAGGFRDSWMGEQSWNAGVSTASIRHLEKMTLKGSFSFRQTEGYGMCGSMFVKPGYYPVDVLEFTPGRKTLQEYAFDGGISYDVAPGWRIGAEMDFSAANLAKKKDLRHTNWRLDMTVSPGVMYHKGDFAAGISYIFGKNSESVNAEEIGISESSYYAFLDKGMMYGIYSVWNGSGLHLDESGINGFPVKEFLNGAAMQMQYKGFFAEGRYLHRKGTIGEKESIWFRYPSNEVAMMLGYSGKGHIARLSLGWKGLKMYETVLESITSNGVTNVYEYGSNRILTESSWDLRPSYEYVSDIWEILTSAEYSLENRLSSQIYPYIYRQTLSTWRVNAQGTVHIWKIDIRLGAGYAAGKVSEEKGLVEEDSGVQTSPYRLQEWYDLEMEYQTADRISADLSVRFNFWKGLYVQAGGHWLHGFGLEHIGAPDRYGANVKFGYNF